MAGHAPSPQRPLTAWKAQYGVTISQQASTGRSEVGMGTEVQGSFCCYPTSHATGFSATCHNATEKPIPLGSHVLHCPPARHGARVPLTLPAVLAVDTLSSPETRGLCTPSTPLLPQGLPTHFYVLQAATKTTNSKVPRTATAGQTVHLRDS